MRSPRIRFIPVRTGQIVFPESAFKRRKVHPRANGGRFSHNCTPCSFHGFIPVHTGQMRPAVRTGNSPPVHPRVYGADYNLMYQKIENLGSSPCIRGRLYYQQYKLSDAGLIPVYTGQILNFPKISETTKSPILSQIPAVGSVCLTFSKYIFADNAFWSKTDKITSSVFRTCFITIR